MMMMTWFSGCPLFFGCLSSFFFVFVLSCVNSHSTHSAPFQCIHLAMGRGGGTLFSRWKKSEERRRMKFKRKELRTGLTKYKYEGKTSKFVEVNIPENISAEAQICIQKVNRNLCCPFFVRTKYSARGVLWRHPSFNDREKECRELQKWATKQIWFSASSFHNLNYFH